MTLEQIERKTPGGRVGVELHRDGWCLGTWIDAEWDGESPRSRLFAAAPDLLEACNRLVAAVGTAALPRDCELVKAAFDARAAIAKAGGGAS